jgi:hypothetical protein
MKTVSTLRVSSLIAAACFALAGCGGNDKAALDKLDSKLGSAKANADPALTAALEDQIMVDPSLTQQSNEDSVRPADQPYQAPIPVDPESTSMSAKPGQTLGALAAEQAQLSKTNFNGCSLDVQYSVGWSNRLPVELPLYPKARVSEAAGSDNGGCKLRAVTYTSAAPPRAMVDFYLTLAKNAGYQAHASNDATGMMVSGVRASDGGAFYVVLQPSGVGTSADIVSNRGS